MPVVSMMTLELELAGVASLLQLPEDADQVRRARCSNTQRCSISIDLLTGFVRRISLSTPASPNSFFDHGDAWPCCSLRRGCWSVVLAASQEAGEYVTGTSFPVPPIRSPGTLSAPAKPVRRR